MNRSLSLEALPDGSSRDSRELTRIFAPLASGVLIALVASTLWAVYAGNVLRDAGRARARQVHMHAGFCEEVATLEMRVFGASEIGSGRIHPDLAGLDSVEVVLSEEAFARGESLEDLASSREQNETFIIRYTRTHPEGRSLLFYVDGYWKSAIKQYDFLKNGIIITILSIVIVSLSPITVLLLSMIRRRSEMDRFMDQSGSSPESEFFAEAMKAVTGDSGVPVVLIDGRGIVASMSSGAASLLEPEQGSGAKSFSSLVSLPVAFRERCLMSRSAFREKVDLVKATGSAQRVEALYQPVSAGSRYFGGVLFLLSDRQGGMPSERAGVETEARQEQEVLTGMVRGLAHDLNNRVAGIVGAASLGIREATVDWELAGRFRDILKEAGKLSDVCSELQLLLLNAGSESGICDPSHEMARISQVLRSVMPFNITVEAGGVSRYKIMVDRGLLRQFFFSLALASSDQMKGGTGRIRINLSDRLPRQILSPDVERGSRICLRYSDGFIMQPELRDVFSAREYEPADVDRQFGTAYGTAYRASLEFGGWISFERGMGETILCLVLKGIASLGSADAPSDAALTGENGVRVLLADDVDLVRETLGEFLRSQDFQVVTASGGDETMDELSKGAFDVIVLDLNMPGIPSIRIAAHCLESFARMAVILTSGYEKPEGIQALLAHDRVVFLPKPSPPGELVRLVNTLVTTMRRMRDDSPE